MENNKQTAVEWLVKTLELDTRFNGIMNDFIEQAIEMEKQQMALFFDKGTGYGICVASGNSDGHPYPSYKAVYNEFYETKE